MDTTTPEILPEDDVAEDQQPALIVHKVSLRIPVTNDPSFHMSIDGQAIRGVVSVKVEAAAGKLTHTTVTFLSDVAIESDSIINEPESELIAEV